MAQVAAASELPTTAQPLCQVEQLGGSKAVGRRRFRKRQEGGGGGWPFTAVCGMSGQHPTPESTSNIHLQPSPPASISSLRPSHYTSTFHLALACNSPAAAAALLPDRISMSKRSGEVIADSVHSCFPKRLRFSSMVFMSLSNAIESWENAGTNLALHPLPTVNILASVVKWGVPKKCRGIIT